MSLKNFPKSINLEEFIKDITDVKMTNEELSKKYKRNERSIRRYKGILRNQGLLKEFDYTNYWETKNEEGMGIAKITKPELLKLLYLNDNNKAKVADIIGVSRTTVRKYCDDFDIVTDEDRAQELVKVLLNVNGKLKNYEYFPKETDVAPEAFNILLGDWHSGKEIQRSDNEYNLEVFEQRSDQLIEGIMRLLLNHVKISTEIGSVNIFNLGDLVDGRGIYSGQEYHQVASIPKQVLLVYQTQVKLVKALLDEGYPVTMHNVKGNHGNFSDNPEDNFDYLIYLLLENWKNMMQIDNLRIETTAEDFLDVNIYDWKIHMRHKTYNQAKTSAGRSKVLGWAINHDNADTILGAHFHSPAFEETNRIDVIRNGCLCGQDDFADQLGVSADPTQVVFGSCDKRKMSFFYRVDLL